MIRLVPRRQRSRAMVWGAPLLAVALTLITGGLTFAIMGKPMGVALFTFFVQPLTSVYGISELIVKASPLVLIGIGLSLGFRANVWNIGAEGQYTFGAILGGGIAIFFHDSTSPFLLPAMLIAGVVGGMAWAAIPALLRTRFNANEILVSLMLTYVAILLLSYLVHGPWRDPDGYNFPESRLFPEVGTMPVLIEGTRVHLGVFFALIAVAVALVLGKGLTGFKLKLVGLAPEAARFAGFSETGVIWFALLAGGGLAGLAGVIEVAGPIGQLIPTISPGYGFTAIIVAFLGRLHPVGVLLAGLVMALTYLGGETAQIEIGVPAAVTGLFQGFLLFYLLACDVLIRYRIHILIGKAA
ncbi:MAG: ABC transporter permease [Rhodospirillales bacterium]|jgi:general nucleoside transport system permease protein|nr:ABC transporter permease [Rhodospirillales bacterium]